jgi:hypothetical protein
VHDVRHPTGAVEAAHQRERPEHERDLRQRLAEAAVRHAPRRRLLAVDPHQLHQAAGGGLAEEVDDAHVCDLGGGARVLAHEDPVDR